MEKLWLNFILLLLWKNWLIQKRHKIQILIDLSLPIMLVGVLVILRSLTDPVARTNDTIYDGLFQPKLSKLIQLVFK